MFLPEVIFNFSPSMIKIEDKKEFMDEPLGKLQNKIARLEKELARYKLEVKKLRDSHKWLKILFEYAPDPYYLNDLKGTFIDGNKAAEKVTGYKRGELIGKSFLKLKLLPPDEIPKAASLLAKNALGKSTGPDEFVFNRKDGSKVILEIRTFPVKIKGKTLVLGIARDITEKKKIEDALRTSEKKYRTLTENISDILIQIDLQGNIIYMSKNSELKTGYSREDVQGKNIKDLLTPDSYEKAFQRIKKWIGGAKDLPPYEIKVKGKDGRIIPFEIATSPIIEDGRIKAIQVIARDITERKQAERKLQKSFEKTNKILKGIINALVSIVEIKDPYTAGHQKRVAKLACAIAEKMHLPEERINALQLAATIHDIGKVNIPFEILSKSGRLNEMELAIIREHSLFGYKILKEIDFPWPIAKIILQHHERMNGSGYPQGLSGKDIMLEARILAVADVVEAMLSHRPYRPALSLDKALEEILKNKGILYDPDAVDACVKLLTRKRFRFED